MKHLIIIGNGITGITVARNVRKHTNMKITIISTESDYFFSRTALMYIYMGHMTYEQTKPYEDWFWQKNNLNLVKGFVKRIDTDQQSLLMDDGQQMSYDILVIATGSKSNKFGWPGQDLKGVQGLYSLQDLELLEENTKDIRQAVLVGGGLIGVEMAEMLLSRHIKVIFLVREKYFWDIVLPEEEAKLVSLEVISHGIDLRLSTQLKEIIPDQKGRVRAVRTDHSEEIGCQFVGLTVGVYPNISVVEYSKINTNRGILVNDYLETNIENVYAAGDCAEIITPGEQRNNVEQLWYTGRMQAETLAKTICGTRTKYERGIWFNSAKFFNLEYQSYGFVSNIPKEDEDSFYWQSKDGHKCLRIVSQKASGQVTGFNCLGIRLNHRLCEQWIEEKRTVRYVLDHLHDANFDPEFFKSYEREIWQADNDQLSVKLK